MNTKKLRKLSAQEKKAAKEIKKVLKDNTPVSRLLMMIIDSAGDDYLFNEFHQAYPEILDFLILSGTLNDEVMWMHFRYHHKNILKCRAKDCNGDLDGNCPAMYCQKCKKPYYIVYDKLSDLICDICVASKIGECTLDQRKKRHIIYVTDRTE
jgi:hypothetical protein